MNPTVDADSVFLNAHLPSEATRLKTSITFIAGTMETRGSFHNLLACDTHLLADSIVDVRTMRGENLAI